MRIPPRPLPLSDRIYLRARYRIDKGTLRRLEQLGLDRDEMVRLLEEQRLKGLLTPGFNAG